MIGMRPLGTAPLAVYVGRDEFVEIEHEGEIAQIAQTVGIIGNGLLCQVAQTVISKIEFDGVLCVIAQTVSSSHEGEIAQIAQTVSDGGFYPFANDVTFGDFGAFGIRIVTGAGEIPACDLLDSIEITFEEDKAALAKMVFKQNAGQVVDLFQHLNQKVRIELIRPNKQPVVVYDGKFDSNAYQIGQHYISWSAITPRERMIEALTNAQISAIGTHDVNVFRKLDDYDDKKSLVADRLSTIPASLDFIGGNPTVTSWMPKAVADYALDACAILRDGTSNNVLSQENVKNKVKIKLQHQWDLLLHVERTYYFDSNYSVCDYGAWGVPPTNATVKSAAQGTGWVLSDYASRGLHPAGMYQCAFGGGLSTSMWWNPKSGNFTAADEDDPDSRRSGSIVNHTNQYAQSAQFVLSKRLAQPVEELIEVTVQNSASIKRYEERETTLNVSVYQDREEATDRKVKRWEYYNEYKNPARSGAQQQANGYWTRRADNLVRGSLESALNVAKRVAEVMILASHRTIELTLKSRQFAPQFDVTQTHDVNFQHVKGRFKVARVVHKMDLANKWAHSEVTYKLFANAENQTYSVQITEPPRAALNMFENPSYNGHLGVYNIEKGAQVFYDEEEWLDYQDDTNSNLPSIGAYQTFLYWKASGLITESTDNIQGFDTRQELEFQVIADEIEEESTDTMEIKAEKVLEMAIPNDLQELIA